MRHKKYILIHYLLSHTLYEIYFSVVKVNISLLYVSTVKSQISKYLIIYNYNIAFDILLALGKHGKRK